MIASINYCKTVEYLKDNLQYTAVDVDEQYARCIQTIDTYLTTQDWQRDACLGHSVLLPDVNY